ncbi:MAG: hypothetical protein HKL97_01050 [Acidocella sp.]|nr:hypothetical protein [Acidocella sp.]
MAVQKAAARLATALEALHAPAIAALNMDQHHLGPVDKQLVVYPVLGVIV